MSTDNEFKEMQNAIKDLQKQVNELNKPTAQQKAFKKYSKGLNGYYMRFRKQENDAWNWLGEQNNKSQYLKNLIYADMKSKNIKITNPDIIENYEYSILDDSDK